MNHLDDVVNRLGLVLESGRELSSLIGEVLATLRLNVDRGEKSIVADHRHRAELMRLVAAWEAKHAALERKRVDNSKGGT